MGSGDVDRPLGPFRSSTKVLGRSFVGVSLVAEVKRFNTECTEKRRMQIGNGNGLNRAGAEIAEKHEGEAATFLTLWQAGAQQAAPLPVISGRAAATTDRLCHNGGFRRLGPAGIEWGGGR